MAKLTKGQLFKNLIVSIDSRLAIARPPFVSSWKTRAGLLVSYDRATKNDEDLKMSCFIDDFLTMHDKQATGKLGINLSA